jgi:hypothetical protein
MLGKQSLYWFPVVPYSGWVFKYQSSTLEKPWGWSARLRPVLVRSVDSVLSAVRAGRSPANDTGVTMAAFCVASEPLFVPRGVSLSAGRSAGATPRRGRLDYLVGHLLCRRALGPACFFLCHVCALRS